MLLEITWGARELDFKELVDVYISIPEHFTLSDVY